MSSYPPLRVGMLVAGMCLCLYYLMAAVNADYEGAVLMLLPGAVTTGFRVWTLMPGLDSALFVESVPFYLLRCARLYDLPFAIGCMVFVCRRFALLFDRTEQLARELDARVAERTKELTAETEARKSMMLNIFHDLRSPLFAVSIRAASKDAWRITIRQ
jgi:C4-dicarboxylate-specific signal transduction histidine kinase